MNIKGLLIDLDDTLCDTKHLYTEAIDLCCARYNQLTGENMSYEEFMNRYKKARNSAKAFAPTSAAKSNRAIYFQNFVEQLESSTSFSLVYELYTTYYDHVYNGMKLFDGAVELLEYAHEKGWKVVIVSDGNSHVRIQKIHALGIEKYIDFLVSSEEVGISKPASQPYLLAMHKADLNIHDCVMIGNSSVSDILGAKRLGIPTIQTDITTIEINEVHNEDEMADYIVHDLREVVEVLEGDE